ncbi:uncharacterized protein PG986_001808 [Apiospora aurea]|uniref:Uncharacterized protein n=1 Tax=Apiospora aurea TaxID=335848 RepID=A0ABR1QYX1_9PEZI
MAYLFFWLAVSHTPEEDLHRLSRQLFLDHVKEIDPKFPTPFCPGVDRPEHERPFRLTVKVLLALEVRQPLAHPFSFTHPYLSVDKPVARGAPILVEGRHVAPLLGEEVQIGQHLPKADPGVRSALEPAAGLQPEHVLAECVQRRPELCPSAPVDVDVAAVDEKLDDLAATPAEAFPTERTGESQVHHEPQWPRPIFWAVATFGRAASVLRGVMV